MSVNVNGILIVYGFKFVGKNEFVTVTHIINPCKFMVQLREDQSTLKKLSRQMNSWAKAAGTMEVPTQVKPGMSPRAGEIWLKKF